MGQRRWIGAIPGLVTAGLMKVRQPRRINEEGNYVGLRAIRVVTVLFFEYLGLAKMLANERRRATEKLQRRAAKANRSISALMDRLRPKMRFCYRRGNPEHVVIEKRRTWSLKWAELVKAGADPPEAQRLTNQALGYPLDFSPGQFS